MARLYSHKKGKSRSTKPAVKKKPVWMQYSAREVELLVVKLAKEGLTPSKIGIKLRDVYGIPDVKVITGKSITKILAEKQLLPELPEDLAELLKKAVRVKQHLDNNKHDMTAKRGLQLTESKILRLVKYYKRVGKLPKDWKYNLEQVKLLVS
ncbi:30S ribosomal protein S15 [Candidatus Woesearchaeota archaeon]|nr:30S ribosomal protein S15 [Candidatus Woesearchaeota archaeon]